MNDTILKIIKLFSINKNTILTRNKFVNVNSRKYTGRNHVTRKKLIDTFKKYFIQNTDHLQTNHLFEMIVIPSIYNYYNGYNG